MVEFWCKVVLVALVQVVTGGAGNAGGYNGGGYAGGTRGTGVGGT